MEEGWQVVWSTVTRSNVIIYKPQTILAHGHAGLNSPNFEMVMSDSENGMGASLGCFIVLEVWQ